MDTGDCVRINKSVLDKCINTATFFSLRRTTESLPRIPTAVSPQVLTALKAYST